MRHMRPNTIREILKVTEQPEVISFAGGLPAPELFPVAEILAATERVLREAGPQALRYGPTEGFSCLRECLAAEMQRRQVPAAADNILVTTGSQQAIDLVGRVFLDPGDCVVTENPTYLAAIHSFQAYAVRFATVPMDECGLIPEALAECLRREKPKLLYTVANFQNPTGRTLTAERRAAIYSLAARHGLVVVEDDPYGELRYAGSAIPPIKSLDTEGRIVYLSTVSKTIAPGLRIGWVVAAPEIHRKLVIAKQAADLHSSSLDQRVVHRYLLDCDHQAHVQCIRRAYRERHEAMDDSLQQAMPTGFSWTHPEGGMFLWVTCPSSIDCNQLMLEAMQRKVLFVPGQDFFPDGSGHHFMRLNFSNASPERIREGIRRLADVCQELEVRS
jgi:2-aminoadipate transaminase